jgi:hypothetical protein
MSASSRPPVVRLPRVPFDRPVNVWPTGRPTVKHTRASNLSLGGIFVEMDHPPQVGTRLSVALDVKPSTLQLGVGVVVWRRSGSHPGHRLPVPHGCGLKFIVMERGGKQFIEAVVRHGGTSAGLAPVLPNEAKTDPAFMDLDVEPKTDPQS